MSEKPLCDQDQLRKLYHEECLSKSEIAEKLGVSTTTVHRRMETYGIDSRSPWEARRIDIDESTLIELYVEQEMGLEEVAEELEVSPSTVRKRMVEYGIERRDVGEMQTNTVPPKELLTELYWGKNLSLPQIGERFGVSKRPVRGWFDKYDIGTRDTSAAARAHGLRRQPSFYMTNGYYIVATEIDGERWYVPVHRLAAVAWFGFDAVAGKIVHHKSGVKWDNREENLELLTQSEHMKLHWERGDFDRKQEHTDI